MLSLVAYVTADIGITAAQNQYLPPKQQGYNYDRPSIPFGTAPQTVEYKTEFYKSEYRENRFFVPLLTFSTKWETNIAHIKLYFYC